MNPNLWWMLAWSLSAWKSTRISWLIWEPMGICAPALGEAKALHAARNESFAVPAKFPDVCQEAVQPLHLQIGPHQPNMFPRFISGFSASKDRRACLNGWLWMKPLGSRSNNPAHRLAAKLTRDQYHELLVGLKKLNMPSKTELALVPVATANEELGKAPYAKKAATSKLGKAPPKKCPCAWGSTSTCQGQAWKSQA